MDTKIMGNKIAEARKNANLSQAQLAQHLFISPQAVGKWERGESVPDIITVNRLAEILGVDLNYFSAQFPTTTSSAAAEPINTPTETPVKTERKLSWDMSRGNWADADFSGLKNLHEKFGSSNMQRCKFIGSDMSGLQLKRNNVDSCDFSGSDFSDSHFQSTYLSGNQFNNCILRSVELQGSYASSCDFSGADFTGMVIRSGGLEKSNMTDVVLSHTSFTDTHLADLVLGGSIEDCSFEQCTFTRVTFQDATITNTFFKSNSLKKIKFINCQADRLTYEFLKSGKADLSGISIIAE
ncbi:pentapeptide repeat-containing protein [Edaphocola aurantiacus]|uniref:pentapeptide repeat-containing protein n=1 Tax=Edaphocola aurantiacus TaxID=2601682 RepID=UPI001C9782A2|nr:pentapeptide repeat-containing protein [Edaphocola aurantiacus]